MVYIIKMRSPIGELTVACSEEAVTGLWFEVSNHFGYGLPQNAVVGHTPLHDWVATWLTDYFAGRQPEITVPLAPSGTEFQMAVWRALRRIPYGETTSYGAIARLVTQQTGRSAGARAVGGAVGRNPISILIPCHRVIGADGSLTGFGGGLERKIFLLALEAGG